MSKTLVCPGCHKPYKLGEPYMGEMCDTNGKCNEEADEYIFHELRETDRSFETKQAFLKYMSEHPAERFWQAVRNFSEYDFIVGSNVPPHMMSDSGAVFEDTFYKETR